MFAGLLRVATVGTAECLNRRQTQQTQQADGEEEDRHEDDAAQRARVRLRYQICHSTTRTIALETMYF